MKKTILLIILIYCSSILPQENLSLDEMKYLVRLITKIQYNYDELKQINFRWQDGDLDLPDKNLLSEYSNIVLSESEILNSKEFLENEMLSPFRVILIDSIFNKSQTYIFLCYNIEDHPEKRYYLAVSKLGQIYLLKNFWRDDFEKLICNQFNIINEKNILKVINLYLNTVKSSHYSREIIDSTNIKKYSSKFSCLTPVKIKLLDKGYKVQLYTLEPFTEELVLYEFIISYSCKIEINYLLINESKVSLE